MKKIVLFAVSLALCVSAMAQNQRAFFTLEKAQPVVMQHMAPAQKAELGLNQRLMGLYTTDEHAAKGKGLDFGQNMTAPFGAEIPTKIVSRYVGGRIVGIRYAMAAAEKVTKVFVQKPAQTPRNVVEKAVTGKCQVGWNTVMFDKPYTIADASSSLIIGFEGTSTGNAGSLSIANADMPHENGFMIYAAPNGGRKQWITISYKSGELVGDLSVQAIVEFDNLPKQDLQLSDFDIKPYGGQGKDMAFAVNVRENGTETANDYELSVMFDDKVVNTVKSKDALADNSETTIEGKFTVPADASIAEHTVTVQLAKVNGVAPTENLNDDKVTAKINVFQDTKPRQKVLLEHYTSVDCPNCPRGDKFLEDIDKLRGDVAWVSIHGDMGRKDPMNTVQGTTIMSYGRCQGFPSASFNRVYNAELAAALKANNASDKSYIYFIWGTPASYNQKYVVPATQMPAFTTITVKSVYDPSTKKINVKVDGEGVKNAASFLDGYGLYVYLTESGVMDYQASAPRSKKAHNNVLRHVFTSAKGDDITWNGDNFTASYSYQVPASYTGRSPRKHVPDVDKMNVIAFVAPKVTGANVNVKKMALDNCEMAKVEGASAVENVEVSDADAEVVAVYSITGQQLSAPQKGINIVRLSNGKTKKIMVTE